MIKPLNLPNKLSLFRIFLVPLLVALIITKYSSLLAATVFGLAMLTDWLDGYIARTTNQITTLGKLLDPVADKLLVCAALISLVGTSKVPAWIVVIIIGRELAITGLRAVAASQAEIIAAGSLGKYKTTVQAIAIVMLILNIPPWDMVVLWLALILTLVSGVDYFIKFAQKIEL